MFVQTIIFSVLWKISLSARILAVFHLSSYSQQSISLPITKELSLRGHEVVVFTSHPLKDRSLVNLTEIDLSYLRKYYSGKDGLQKQLTTDQSFENYVRNFYNFDKFLSESVLNNADFQKMYRDPNEKFDLIFIHGLSPTFHILGKRFKAPVIGITSLPATISNHESVGNVVSQLIYSNMIDWHFEKTELIKKVLNLFHFIWYKYYYNWHIIPTYDAMVRKALDDDMPSLSILEKNVSFMYINDHPILHKVRPSVPTILYLNQIHIKPVKPLPEDLRQIIDNAKNGVVYFSLGSNVQCINIKKDLLNVIIETCNELPFTVLFKWEYDDFPGKSKNIVNRKWFPQQDLLAHENVKVFITQGGLQSIEEAVVHVKPMVGIPFASDQYYNVKTLEKHGAAISIDINTVTKEELKNAIIQVARNKSYKETMRKLKTLHVDVPMSGLEKAVWWAEYVIRHRGTSHLRSITADMSLFEFLLIDTIIIFILIALITYRIYTMLFKTVLNQKRKTE